MKGNRETPTDAAPIHFVLRITFGVVHGVLMTVMSLGLILFFPSLSHLLFGLFGCVVAPLFSLLLTIGCNACLVYISKTSVNMIDVLKTCWIPPLGVFLVALFILPLEMMPSLGFSGPMNTLVKTFVVATGLLTTLLQIYAGRGIQYEASAAPSP